MNLELHRELYLFEWNRKEQLSASANLPVAMLSVLFGGMFFLLRTFPYDSSGSSVAFLVLASMSLLGQAAAILFVARSLLSYWYEQIPAADKLQTFYEELQQWHADFGSPEECQQDFDTYLQERMSEATASNLENNTKKAAALINATRSVLFALIFGALSLFPYFPHVLGRDPETARVKVEGTVRTEASMSQNPRPQPEPRPQPATSRPAPPPKPTGPPNVEVREGGGKREKR